MAKKCRVQNSECRVIRDVRRLLMNLRFCFFFLCECFLERVRENTFFQKRFSRNLIKNYCAASTIAVNFSATREAPPMRPPSTLGFASSSAAFFSFIEPPY